MKKKVLFVLPHMTGGGAERVTAILANKLVDKNCEVHIHTLITDDSFYYLRPEIKQSSDGVSVNRRNKITLLFSESFGFIKSMFSVLHKIKSEKYDIVISFFIETDVIVYLCKILGCNFMEVHSERNDPWQRSKMFKKIRCHIYKKCDKLVCQSKAVSDYFDFVEMGKKYIISNPIDKEKIPDRIAKHSKKIVSVARLFEQKNYPLLIKSFSLVCNEFPGYTLNIYGDGILYDSLLKMINELNLNERVFLHGAKKNVMKLISDAELFIMSSNYEGFPNALLEAMAIGIPVISTDFQTGVARELIGDDNGIVVPVNDEMAMSSAIRTMLNDYEKMLEMGYCNRKKCEQFYTDKIIEKWIEALEIE